MSEPFIKVEWQDTPENITQERIKRVKTYFQNKYKTKYVKVKTSYLTNDTNTKLKSLEASDNILDPQYQKKLVKDFMEENDITIKWDLINRLDDKVNAEINKTEQSAIRYNKWRLRKIEFSNFLSFGEDNVIDFDGLDGITVIESEPKNFGGKTISTIDLIMFLFFNTTTKNKINAEIFNLYTDIDEVKVKGYITIDGSDYVVKRNIIRKKSRSGDYNVKSNLEFYTLDDDGNAVNLSDDQRRTTEKIITSAIGTQEDFLSTILTTGNNLEELIESKPTARGQILTRFLGLEALKQKEDVCNKMYSDWSKKLTSNLYNTTQLNLDNDAHRTSINDLQLDIIKLTSQLKEFEKSKKELEKNRDELLSSINNDIDKELIKTNPTQVQNEIDNLIKVKNVLKKEFDEIIVIEPSEYYIEDDHEEIKQQLTDLTIKKTTAQSEIDRHKNIINEFETGTSCPLCKRPFEKVDHTEEIDKFQKEIKKLEETLEKYILDFDILTDKDKKLKIVKDEYYSYENKKLLKTKSELEIKQKEYDIDTKKTLLEKYENIKKKLEENKKIEVETTILKTKIETADADIKLTNNSIEKNQNNITNMSEKIRINEELIKKIKSEEEYIGVFKAYLLIYGKNGISKVIMKNMIPLLNQELHRILSDSCYFTLELSINDKNELEFLMIDNDTRIVKSLLSGSGYEKTISSLALRSVLTKISSLPKPNIVVMDEVFGKIADENLELVGEFFKKIKNYFEHIFLISHNSLIRNWSDNIIMIKKEDNVSGIDYIKTKIT